MDHFRKAEQLIEQAETWNDAAMSSRERVDRRKADFLGAIAHGLLGLAEALDPPARPALAPKDDVAPLDDLMDGPGHVQVPLLKIPMRKETEVSP